MSMSDFSTRNVELSVTQAAPNAPSKTETNSTNENKSLIIPGQEPEEPEKTGLDAVMDALDDDEAKMVQDAFSDEYGIFDENGIADKDYNSLIEKLESQGVAYEVEESFEDHLFGTDYKYSTVHIDTDGDGVADTTLTYKEAGTYDKKHGVLRKGRTVASEPRLSSQSADKTQDGNPEVTINLEGGGSITMDKNGDGNQETKVFYGNVHRDDPKNRTREVIRETEGT